MQNHSLLFRPLVAGFAVVLILGYASTGIAQSGRRARKPEPVPVATPEPTPSPKSSSSSERPKPRFTFLVGLNRHEAFANLPLYSYEGVLGSVVDRLGDSPVVQVNASQGDMSRSDAVKMAKAEREGYVILLGLQMDTMSSNNQNSSYPDIIIEYSVLAPTTAKQVNYGRTYTQAQRQKGGILNPRTSGIYGDRYLIQAAQEAADRILAYFRSHGPTQPIKLPLVGAQASLPACLTGEAF